jgi:para-nitrobenzyl esterase
MSVGCLLAMPSAEGLFHKAIPQSGACHTALSKSEALRVAETVMELLETDDPDALMELSEAALTEVQTKLSAIASERGLPGMSFQPVIDGDVLPTIPIERIRAGSAAGIAIMAGCTTEEWKLFSALDPLATNMSEEALTEAISDIFGDSAADVIGSYRSWLADSGKGIGPGDVSAKIMTDRVFWVPAMALLEAQRAHDARTYGYLFDWKSPLMGGAMGACHAVELGFVWGTYDKNGAGSFFGEGPAADALSDFTRAAWIRFAHTGHPGGGSGPAWPSYDAESRATMVFSNSPDVVTDPADSIRELWTGVPESKLGTL